MEFKKLKQSFTTVSVLIISAILSQRSVKKQQTTPLCFSSRKLSPTERNYVFGDRELLAIKVALEEWRHWLEGAEQPFLVWTDHKNLEYLRKTKRLNARRALFFNRFNFTLSYRPGSKNVILDTVACLTDHL